MFVTARVRVRFARVVLSPDDNNDNNNNGTTCHHQKQLDYYFVREQQRGCQRHSYNLGDDRLLLSTEYDGEILFTYDVVWDYTEMPWTQR